MNSSASSFFEQTMSLMLTRPDTRQSSRRPLGRSNNAKTTWNSKIWRMDRPTDGRTDWSANLPTDKARCRVACPQLKIILHIWLYRQLKVSDLILLVADTRLYTISFQLHAVFALQPLPNCPRLSRLSCCVSRLVMIQINCRWLRSESWFLVIFGLEMFFAFKSRLKIKLRL